jgi:hypothetical protein
MVGTVRSVSVMILSTPLNSQPLVNTVLHHQALTAKPQMEIARALLAIILHDDASRKNLNIDEQDKAAFLGILGQIHAEYNDLVNARNNLLHGTWFIGYASQDQQDFSEFSVAKFTTSKSGLRVVEDLPKTAKEMQELSTRCEKMTDWIHRLHACLAFSGQGIKITNNFFYDAEAKQWCRTPPSP